MKNPNEAPYEWGYLLGLLDSDGHVFGNKHMRFRGIVFVMKDKDVIERVNRYVNTICGSSYSIFPIVKPDRKPTFWEVSISNPQIMNEIKPLQVGTYTWRVPSCVLDGEEQIKKGFLNGFFDGDGTVSRRLNKRHYSRYVPQLHFVSVNTEGLAQLAPLLKSFNVNANPQSNGKKGRRLAVTRKLDILQYWLEIGITGERKREIFKSDLAYYVRNTRQTRCSGQATLSQIGG